MKYERKAWAFLRTMTRDYRYGSQIQSDGSLAYPWREVGPDYCPHLRHFLFDPDAAQLVRLFWTRAQARGYAKTHRERGHAVRVRIRVEEA